MKRPVGCGWLGGPVLLCLCATALCWPAPSSALVISGLEEEVPEADCAADAPTDGLAPDRADSDGPDDGFGWGSGGGRFALTLGPDAIVYDLEAVSRFCFAPGAGGWPSPGTALRIELRELAERSLDVPFGNEPDAPRLGLGAKIEELLARILDLRSSARRPGRAVFPFLAFLQGDARAVALGAEVLR